MNDRQKFLDVLTKKWLTWIENKYKDKIIIKKIFTIKNKKYVIVANFSIDGNFKFGSIARYYDYPMITILNDIESFINVIKSKIIK